jgi:adenine-specific DNA methylase
MTNIIFKQSLRPGKYIEYDFPLREVNRLAQKEAYSKKPIYTMHKWWARRLSCVFRTVLLASLIDWADWDALEPWKRDADGDYVNAEGCKVTDERDYHRRVRDERPSSEWYQRTNGLLERRPTAWERLYYRLDEEANAVIEKAFKGQLVLDPFMGGGTTIVEALRLGADVAGSDLNPVAWFTVKKETDGIEPEALEAAFKQVEVAVAEEIKSYYKTRCPACDQIADVMYVFWVKVARCLEQTCGAEVPLYNSFILAKYGSKREVPSSDNGTPGMRLSDGKAKSTNFIVCPDCGEVYASFERVTSDGSTCPSCGHNSPADLLKKGYAGYGKYTCPTCGSAHAILDAAKEQGQLPFQMYGIEATCPHCGFKGYKKPDADDITLYERARHRFEVEREALDIPEQEIPVGLSTSVEHDLPGHGFKHWRDLFTERQLLLLAYLRDAILCINNPNAREYLLLAWSAAINTNSLLCRYNPIGTKVEPVFTHHAFIPKLTSTEGNLWGAEYGRGTYQNQVDLIRRGMDWSASPYDNFFLTDEDYTKVDMPEQLFPLKTERQLFCRSAEELPLETQCAAAVITDPPYYGNVMYAELSDFFYVWLRTALYGSYPDIFEPKLTSKEEEIVDQKSRAASAEFITKDENFFTAGLTRVFTEAGRILQDDGAMVFTFHHQANEAWASVLKTVLDAGFIIKAVYPVHAEAVASLHIRDKANIAYDALIVCRKQTEVPSVINWREIADQIYLRAERLVKELEGESRGLLPEDIYVIVIGQCLELYSRHTYRGRSYVMWQDQPVSIEDALDGNEERGIEGIGEIVDQLVEEAEGRLWPSGLDPLSRFYVINFLGQSEVAYDRLKRRLMHNPHVSLDALAQRQLITQAGSKVKVTPVMERADFLLSQFGGTTEIDQLVLPGMETSGEPLTAVDKLHLLIALDLRGALIGNLLGRWGQDRVFVALAQRIAELLDPKAKHYRVYQRIADTLNQRTTFSFEGMLDS